MRSLKKGGWNDGAKGGTERVLEETFNAQGYLKLTYYKQSRQKAKSKIQKRVREEIQIKSYQYWGGRKQLVVDN